MLWVSDQLSCVQQKYTVGSRGIWEKIRRFFAIDPNRSDGIPMHAHYRNIAPGSLNPNEYADVVTLPRGDIAGNPYWKRDTRRNYPALSTFTQQDVVGLLQLGSKAAPRIADGKEGEKQLVEVKQGGPGLVLAEVLKNRNVATKEVLDKDGMPPLPGSGITWSITKDEGFPAA